MDGLKRLQDMLGALHLARQLQSHDRWRPARLRAHQRDAVAKLVRHAATQAPFYAALYRGVDLSAPFDLAALPIVDKKTLMENFDGAVTDRRLTRAGALKHLEGLKGDSYFLGEYRVVATTGTSGLRGHFVYDRSAWRMVIANTLRWNRFMGVSPRFPRRVRIASIGADAPMHVTERIPQSANAGLFAVRHFLATAPLTELREAIARFGPDVILSYPSIAALLALEQIEGRLAIRPGVVSTHSEVLTGEMRARIRDAWGTEPFNHYGLTEEPHVAADCEHHAGLHLFEDTSVVEIVDTDGRPVPDGTPGAKWLLTNLYNFAQPLIRYEVTDVLTRAPGLCPCGRPFGLIAAIGGRSEDVLRLPALGGGAPVPVAPLALGMCVERFHDVAEYTIAHAPDRIVATVAPRTGADGPALQSALEAALADTLRKAGAAPPPIEVRLVDRLERPREKMGKLRLVSGARPGVLP